VIVGIGLGQQLGQRHDAEIQVSVQEGIREDEEDCDGICVTRRGDEEQIDRGDRTVGGQQRPGVRVANSERASAMVWEG
jgi:hypothetical protein